MNLGVHCGGEKLDSYLLLGKLIGEEEDCIGAPGVRVILEATQHKPRPDGLFDLTKFFRRVLGSLFFFHFDVKLDLDHGKGVKDFFDRIFLLPQVLNYFFCGRSADAVCCFL